MHCLLGLAISLLPRASVHGETRFCPPPGPGPNRDYRDNPAYEISQELDIQWDMDFDDAKIYIQQRDVFNNLPEGMSAKVVSSTNSAKYTWKITLDGFSPDFDKTRSNVYYFGLEDASGTAGGTTSHYFNITDPADSTSTAAAPTTTSTASRSGSHTSATASSTTSVTDDDDGDEGLLRGP